MNPTEPLRLTKLAKRAGMFHDAQNRARGAMTSQPSPAPGAMAAGEVDLPGDALADPGVVFAGGNFTHELMPWRAGEAVVSALKFQIGGADSSHQQADSRES